MKLEISYIRWRIIAFLFTIGYSSFFIYAVFFARRRRGLTERFLNPVPVINTIENFFEVVHKTENDLYAFATNLIGNIVLFIPLPFILITVARIRNLNSVLFISFIISLSVEAIQFYLKRGVADVDDILLNILGAYLGYFFYSKLFGHPAAQDK